MIIGEKILTSKTDRATKTSPHGGEYGYFIDTRTLIVYCGCLFCHHFCYSVYFFLKMESNLWRYLLFVYICNAVGDPIIKKMEGWDPIIKKVEGWDLIIKKVEGWDLIIKKVEGWDLIIKKVEGRDLIDRFNPTTLLYLSQAKIWISICICQDIFCV